MDFDLLDDLQNNAEPVSKLNKWLFNSTKQQAFIDLYISLKLDSDGNIVEKDTNIIELMSEIYKETYGENSIFVVVCTYISDSINNGVSRDEAMVHWFDIDIVQIFSITTKVKIRDKEGGNNNILSTLSAFLKHQSELQIKVKKSLKVSIGIMLFGIFGYIMTAIYALPAISDSYSIKLSGYSAMVAQTGELASQIGYLWILIIIIIKKIWSWSLSKFGWLPIYKYQKVAHFFAMLSLIKKTGETTSIALEMMYPYLVPFLKPHVEKMLEATGEQNGYDHLDTGLLSLEAKVKLLSIGRIQSSDSQVRFSELSDFIQRNTTEKIDKLSNITPLLALVISMSMFGIAIFAVMGITMKAMGAI
ncbi:hypothetical protein UA38_11600 [Photobacterium kishitanii]|uniref:Type II secretion system protein GspF domain-containing protein n=3 Tax=Photobacterium kishitanii TaxID=318456 RepID=A0AAX0YRB8_9GAMM|nr:hypothetical protein [Photobacterium kishitanii]KJG57015.1 hypothetical protein UA38_11600 [Photobacterium kishitanii]PSX18369.1 hypothetical protein C0W70_15990 [Photobacterium kishitanii]PSX26870.1 hypothetical protein C0W52_16925 [Photobacterium kishitanii]PSX31156.1 hypothetical protein C0W39_18370 [Photobacterium kishitanii]PSX44075.1 hypothetical protein C0W53_15725 [Photobacterium kishitanii]